MSNTDYYELFWIYACRAAYLENRNEGLGLPGQVELLDSSGSQVPSGSRSEHRP